MAGQARSYGERMNIRQATLQDLHGLNKLFCAYLEFYKSEIDNERSLKFIADRLKKQDSVILLAEIENATLVGFLQMYPTFSTLSQSKRWILNDLFVDPDQRGLGLGRSLLKAATQYSRDTGATGLSLQTAKDNYIAQSLYEKGGWIKEEKYFTYNLTINDSIVDLD